MNRISEFSSRSDGLAKRPREVFTSKQRLMHGSEISREVRQVKEIQSEKVAKPAEKKKRRSFKDAIKMLAGGAAAAAVVAVSATAGAPVEEPTEMPPALPQWEDEKYSYSVYFPTYRETLGPGGYAVVLDVSTEEKKQAFYKYFADRCFEFLRFEEERGEEFRNDPEPNKYLHTVWRSETENGGIMGSIGSSLVSLENDNISWGLEELAFGQVMKYRGSDTEIIDNRDTSTNTTLYSSFSSQLLPSLGADSFTDMKAAFGGKTSEEILELITEPMDKYLFEVNQAEDGTRWTNLRYETMETLEQFMITKGKADIVMPEFFKVVRDDELYGWKTLTVPESGNYMLVTGSDEYPADKPYAYSLRAISLDDMNATSYHTTYFNYDWAEGTQETYFRTTAHAHKNTTHNWLYYGSLELSDFVYSQNFDEPQDNTGTQHIYYDLAAFNAGADTEIIAPQMSRLLPIEDKYYLYKLGGSTMYTITNNGDHEVVVIGNLTSYTDSELDNSNIQSINYRYNDGKLGQYFAFEPLLPGESLTIYSSTILAGDRGVATLTMPECCTVTDGFGDSYSHTGIEIDLLKGTIKED